MKEIELLPRASRKPVAEDDAIQMISFMLEAAAQQSRSLHLDRPAQRILTSADRSIGSSEFQVSAREGQAALVGRLELPILAFGQDDLGVADGTDLAHVIGVRAVEDEDCEIDSYLSCCETDPLSGVHGGEHVADELVELFIEFPDGPGLGVHHWSAPPDDGQHSASGSEVANSQIGSRVHVSTLPSSRM
jgi:hypothetical protein